MFPVVILHRSYKAGHTFGTVVLPSGKVIKTLELPWLNNASNISCYPEGLYLAKWIDRSVSGKYKRVWHIQNVTGSQGILWHTGNLLRHTKGCTLPGMRQGRLGGKTAVLSSLQALNIMRRELGGEDFILYVMS